MSPKISIVVYSLLFIGYGFSTPATETKTVEDYVYHELMDNNGVYNLSWTVLPDDIVEFYIEARTTGWVGLGVSPSGGMGGADIFVGGVHSDGSTYSGDYYSTANGAPTLDEHQDWVLIDGREEDGKTILTVQRPLISCDTEKDFGIGNDTNRMIWAISSDNSDTLNYHTPSAFTRGPKSTNILQAESPTADLSKFPHFTMMVNTTMPEIDTTYWCTWHKGPVLQAKHQIIAFETKLPNDLAFEHTHHFVIFECRVPQGNTQDADGYFGPLLGRQGDHCHSTTEYREYVNNCERYPVYTWAKGGKTMIFPDHVGLPIGETPGEATYYMLEVHYDNPSSLQNLTFETGVNLYYTDAPRQYDAGIWPIGQNIAVSLTVPPNVPNFTVVGHLASQCTGKTLPPEGVTIFNVLQHAHKSGRKMKTRHFRQGVELPWIVNDDFYDFDYQQNKLLIEPVKILPGDQITVECVYDSTWKIDSSGTPLGVLGGFSTYEEMCQSLSFYYPRADVSGYSIYNVDKHFATFHATNYTWRQGPTNKEYYITTDTETEPVEFLEFVSKKFQWTEDFLKAYQFERQYGIQESQCGDERTFVSYPANFVEYVPQTTCKTLSTSTAGKFVVNFVGLILLSTALLVFNK